MSHRGNGRILSLQGMMLIHNTLRHHNKTDNTVKKRRASELFKYLDTLAGIRMSAEERTKEVHHARSEMLRMYYEKLGNVVAAYVVKTGVA